MPSLNGQIAVILVIVLAAEYGQTPSAPNGSSTPTAPGDKGRTAPRPPWQRMLTGQAAATAAALEKRIDETARADHYDVAIRAAEELLALRVPLQGDDHWQVVSQRFTVNELRTVAALPAPQRAEWRRAQTGAAEAARLMAEGRFPDALPLQQRMLERSQATLGQRAPLTAKCCHEVGGNLFAQGKYAEALPLVQRALAINRQQLGENHPETADSYDNVASIIDGLGNHTEALPLFRRALAIKLEQLGENHPDLASCYNNVASNLGEQGEYAAAQPLLQKALDLRRRLLGDDDPDTASSYNDLGVNLETQAKHAEAQPLLQKALDVRQQRLGREHPDTAISLNSLGINLDNQGKHAEAQALYQAALTINRRRLGEGHPATATTYQNLGLALAAQGKNWEAEPLLQKALDLRRQQLGDLHPDTATAYEGLAIVLDMQGKHAAAEPLLRRSLSLRQRQFGAGHHLTAMSYSNLGLNLRDQGKYAAAQPLLEMALDIRRQQLGAQHPDTANSYHSLALTLEAQGKYAEAQPLMQAALAICRQQLGAGHEYTATTYIGLAMILTAQAKNADAIDALEHAARAYESARLQVGERALERAVFGEHRSPYPLLAALRAGAGRFADAAAALEADLARGLLDEARSRRGTALSPTERAEQRAVRDGLAKAQARILALTTKSKPDAATRSELPRLLEERTTLEHRLATLAAALSEREVASLAAIQAMLPAQAALLYWVDAQDIAGGVAEHWACVLQQAGPPCWEKLAGSGPAGKWTKEDLLLPDRLRAALAAGTFQTQLDTLIQSLRAQRLAPLEKHLFNVNQLYVISVHQMAGVPFELLTDRYTISYTPSGTQLAQLRQRPRPTGSGSLLALGDPIFHSSDPGSKSPAALPPETLRGGHWQALPGTRVELAGLSKLFGPSATVLSGADASEQRLDALRGTGQLPRYRYLHFATHCEANDLRAFESALILAQDPLRNGLPRAGQRFFDGRLTANEVLEDWKLDAELVTLSACESALGQRGGGDGLLGFAQAFLAAGARAVCLTLWKVDDAATALLMDRFYQNLLGKRPGLAAPLPKAQALAEAKRWLRALTADEARQRTAAFPGDLARGQIRPATPGTRPAAATGKENHPYAHPRYWAAFVLIGDPD